VPVDVGVMQAQRPYHAPNAPAISTQNPCNRILFYSFSCSHDKTTQFAKQMVSQFLYWTTSFSTPGIMRPIAFDAIANAISIYVEFTSRSDFLLQVCLSGVYVSTCENVWAEKGKEACDKK
jgi:hypothetical protein